MLGEKSKSRERRGTSGRDLSAYLIGSLGQELRQHGGGLEQREVIIYMCYSFSDILVCVCWEKPKVFRGKRKNNIGGSRLCSRRRVSSSPSSCWGVGVLGPSFLTPLTLIDRSRGGEQVRVPSIRGPLFPYSSGSRRLLSLSYTFL